MPSIVNGTKEKTAQALADAHFGSDDGLLRVFRIKVAHAQETSPDEPVKLLEINADTPRNGIVPVHFGADPAHGIAHSSIIVEIGPDEFDELKAKRLPLPEGWTVAEEISPSQ